MDLLAKLVSGQLGIRAAPPPWFRAEISSGNWTQLVDPQLGLRVRWSFVENLFLDLNPQHALAHRDAIARHTHQLFERLFAAAHPTSISRTTVDPGWSPLIEADIVALPGGYGLQILHRTRYERGHEAIVGRLLVSTSAGTFEARWEAGADAMGNREAAVLIREKLAGRTIPPPQTVIDDPQLDALNPAHPLARARAAKSWWRLSHLAVLSPGRAWVGELQAPAVSCAITPPPRFVVSTMSHDHLLFQRVSYSVDEADELYLVRTSHRVQTPEQLAEVARREALEEWQSLGMIGITDAVMVAPDPLPDVSVILTGTRARERIPKRTVQRWFRPPSGQVFYLSVISTPVMPLRAQIEEIDTALRSWRAL